MNKNIEPFPGKLMKSKKLGTPFVLTDEQADWLRRYFPVTADHTLANLMGVAYMTVRRLAATLGITKDKAAYSERCRQTVHAIAESERRRARLCLPKRTKWNLPSKPYTHIQIRKRSQAVKRYDYILADDCSEEGGHRFIIYYDENTRRNKTFEAYSELYGFKFKKWNE